MTNLKIIIVGAYPESILNFRGDLINDLLRINSNVVTVSNEPSKEQLKILNNKGITQFNVPFQRSSINPFNEILCLVKLINILRKEKPDCVIAYTIKPVIWTGIATFFQSNIKFFPLITGLGFAFGEGGLFRNFIKIIAIFLYKISLKKATKVIFQNMHNKKQFTNLNIVKENNSKVINGSGVNLDYYYFNKYKVNSPYINFLMIARLLLDKGIIEFLNAAKIVKNNHPNANFVLVGGTENSKNSVSIELINKFQEKGIIKYDGHVSDVREHIKKCSVFVLPSYHEGMSRSIQEALSIGRPILTTNVPGCRETVIEGENGWLVKKGEITELAEKMIWFIENEDNILKMGEKSREICEQKFNVKKINNDIIKLIKNSF